MTVMQLLPALEAGGVEGGTVEVARALAAAGHRAIVVSAGGRLVRRLQSAGGEHVTLPIGRKSPFSLRYVSLLQHAIMETAPDIVHARSRLPAWIGWRACQRIPPRRRPRFVTTVHGLYSVNRYSAVMTRGERVICVSEVARDYVLANYRAVDPERLVVIPRGVDRSIYAFGFQPALAWRQRWGREHPELGGRKLLTLPGRLTRRKGVHRFIDLIAALRTDRVDVHGLIVGGAAPGKARFLEELKRYVQGHGLAAAVTFTGHRDDVREILAVSDLVLCLSEKPEAFGRTAVEALSLGRPVLGWDHGGVGEQLRSVYPAGAVPLGDETALKRRAKDLLAKAPPVPAEHPYTLARMLEGVLGEYEQLTAARYEK